jgi:hypothetical protein
MTLLEQLQRDLLAGACETAAKNAALAEADIRRAHLNLALALGETENAAANIIPFIRDHDITPTHLLLALASLKQAQNFLEQYFTDPSTRRAPLTLEAHINTAKKLLGIGQVGCNDPLPPSAQEPPEALECGAQPPLSLSPATAANIASTDTPPITGENEKPVAGDLISKTSALSASPRETFPVPQSAI